MGLLKKSEWASKLQTHINQNDCRTKFKHNPQSKEINDIKTVKFQHTNSLFQVPWGVLSQWFYTIVSG